MKKTFLILIMVLVLLLPFAVQSPIINVYASDGISGSSGDIYNSGYSIQDIMVDHSVDSVINFLNTNEVYEVKFNYTHSSGQPFGWIKFNLSNSYSREDMPGDIINYNNTVLGIRFFRIIKYAYINVHFYWSTQLPEFSDLQHSGEYSTNIVLTAYDQEPTTFNFNIHGKDIPFSQTVNLTEGWHTLTAMVDGQVYSTKSFEEGATIQLTAAPNKAGYNFLYWQDQYGTNYVTSSELVLTESLTLTAVYEVIPLNNYILTLVIEGQEVGAEEFEEQTVVTLPQLPIREGYTALGWSYSETGQVIISTSTITMPDSNLTIYGIYELDEEEKPTDPGTEDPTNPTDPNEENPNEEDPTSPGNNDDESDSGLGWFDWLKGPWDWITRAGSDIGKAIGGVAKSIWESDIGKIAVIGIGAIVAIAGIAAIVGIAGGAGGLAAIGAGLKVIAAKVIIPLVTKVIWPIAAKIIIPLLPALIVAGAIWILLPDTAKELIDKGIEVIEWIDENVADPLEKLTGLPKWGVWTGIVLIIWTVYKWFINALKGLFGFGRKKEKSRR
jgi:hypothetical protein